MKTALRASRSHEPATPEVDVAEVHTPEPAAAVVPVAALIVPGLAHGGAALRPKLAVGRTDDPAELAADRTADTVVAELHAGAHLHEGAGARVSQGAVAPEGGPTGGTVSPTLLAALQSARSGGTALPAPVRRDMEDVIGTDLSAVRVHTGPAVTDVAAGISARAFTLGTDVFLPHGLPDTRSPAGTFLLAHELAHVAQERPGARIRRNDKSAAVLTELATPKVFPGPEVELQDAIVKKLEAATPVLTKETDLARQKAREDMDAWAAEAGPKAVTAEEKKAYSLAYTKRSEQIATSFPRFDSTELYLGSVVLAGVPPSADGDAEMIKSAKLVFTDNAFKVGQNGIALTQAAGVDQDIVTNTLRTMIEAKQIEYLRQSGFVGKGWKIVVEIHYIRNRPGSAASFHKDTLGQTLFVNLNYANKEEMAGPEFVINPPLVHAHEEFIEQSLPGEFMADLKTVRQGAGGPKQIRSAGTLGPNAVVSFVDEAIHHSTPLIGHRKLSTAKLATYLATDSPGKHLYAQAKAAFDTSREKPATPPPVAKSGGFLSSLWGSSKPAPQPTIPAPKSFAELFAADLPAPAKAIWERLLAICARDGFVERPELRDAGLDDDEIDVILTLYGPDTFNAVSIPGAARTNPQKTGRSPIADEKTGERPVLKREMSTAALKGKLPPVAAKTDTDEGPKRTFFRTWVRAVKVGDGH